VTLTITTDYTVSGVGVLAGGNVTLVTPATVGDLITISRSMAYSRETDYQNSGDFLADTVDADFNRIWQVLQQHRLESAYTIALDPNDNFTNVDDPYYLPLKADRVGKMLAFDGNGNPQAIDILAAGTSDSALIQHTSLGDDQTTVKTILDEVEAAAFEPTTLWQSSGTDAYTITSLSNPDIGTWEIKEGMIFTVLMGAANTSTSVTITIAGEVTHGPFNAVNLDASPIGIGVLQQDKAYNFVYIFGLMALYSAAVLQTEFVDDGAMTEAKIGDEAISLAKIKNNTAGRLISFSGAGVAQTERYMKWVNLGDRTASGLSVEWTGIPANATMIRIVYDRLSVNASQVMGLQVGHSGAYMTTVGDYIGGAARHDANVACSTLTYAPIDYTGVESNFLTGVVELTKFEGSNKWLIDNSSMWIDGAYREQTCKAVCTVGGTLTRIKLMSANGIATYDSGTATLYYYGNPD
jgi:hypothetical protein